MKFTITLSLVAYLSQTIYAGTVPSTITTTEQKPLKTANNAGFGAGVLTGGGVSLAVGTVLGVAGQRWFSGSNNTPKYPIAGVDAHYEILHARLEEWQAKNVDILAKREGERNVRDKINLVFEFVCDDATFLPLFDANQRKELRTLAKPIDYVTTRLFTRVNRFEETLVLFDLLSNFPRWIGNDPYVLHAAAVTQKRHQFQICDEVGVITIGTRTSKTLSPLSREYYYYSVQKEKDESLRTAQSDAKTTPVGLLILADGLEAFKTAVKEEGFVIIPAYSRPSGLSVLTATRQGENVYMKLSSPGGDDSRRVGSCKEESKVVAAGDSWSGYRCRF